MTALVYAYPAAHEKLSHTLAAKQPILKHRTLLHLADTVDVCMQLEVEFNTLAELELFWAAIPPQDHKAWSQRAQVCTMRPCLSWADVANDMSGIQCARLATRHIISNYQDIQHVLSRP